MSADHLAASTLPENLTHCGECGLEFPEPVTWWDDFFQEVEQASFVCTACADEFDGTAANARRKPPPTRSSRALRISRRASTSPASTGACVPGRRRRPRSGDVLLNMARSAGRVAA